MCYQDYDLTIVSVFGEIHARGRYTIVGEKSQGCPPSYCSKKSQNIICIRIGIVHGLLGHNVK